MQDIVNFIQHHWMLSLAFMLILLVLVILEFIKIRQGTKQLSPLQATQLINHENAVVVDVRSPEAFANGHIVGSISLPVKEVEKSSKKIEKHITQPIILVCANGIDSGRAADQLTKKGFNTFLLSGGLRMWQQAAMPLVKD